jgi:hypothetical protein
VHTKTSHANTHQQLNAHGIDYMSSVYYQIHFLSARLPGAWPWPCVPVPQHAVCEPTNSQKPSAFTVYLARVTQHKQNAAPKPPEISGFQTGIAQQSQAGETAETIQAGETAKNRLTCVPLASNECEGKRHWHAHAE